MNGTHTPFMSVIVCSDEIRIANETSANDAGGKGAKNETAGSEGRKRGSSVSRDCDARGCSLHHTCSQIQWFQSFATS